MSLVCDMCRISGPGVAVHLGPWGLWEGKKEGRKERETDRGIV
jgi:hypothetical protein